jgi:autoinducer 2-degrading protein
VQVKPEHVTDFIAATRLNHEASIKEKGNLRFDILQLPEDPTRFLLYEAYVNPQAAVAHKETPHYLKWRDVVMPWMVGPRLGTVYKGLFPRILG